MLRTSRCRGDSERRTDVISVGSGKVLTCVMTSFCSTLSPCQVVTVAGSADLSTGPRPRLTFVVASRDGASEHNLPVFGPAAFLFDPTGDTLASIAADKPATGAPALPLGPLRLIDARTGAVRTLLDGRACLSTGERLREPDPAVLRSVRPESPPVGTRQRVDHPAARRLERRHADRRRTGGRHGQPTDRRWREWLLEPVIRLRWRTISSPLRPRRLPHPLRRRPGRPSPSCSGGSPR